MSECSAFIKIVAISREVEKSTGVGRAVLANQQL